MPALLDKLDMKQFAKSSCLSPFRQDKNASWGIFQRDGKWYFKDQATGESGDEITLLAQRTGLDEKRDFPLVICEGAATGASVHEATCFATTCVVNCGNLLEVANALRARHPNREIVVAGDNNQWRDSNCGVTKATEAAKAIKAKLVLPQFRDVSGKPTDFNDLHRLEGVETVGTQINAAIQMQPNEQDLEAYVKAAAVGGIGQVA